MLDNDMLTAEDIAQRAMKIAGDLCVYTNHNTMMSSNSISPLPILVNRTRSVDYSNTENKGNIRIGGFNPSVYAVSGQ